MTATGSHFDFDSLRGAPLARNDIFLFGHFAILRQLPGCSRTSGFFDGSRKYRGIAKPVCALAPIDMQFFDLGRVRIAGIPGKIGNVSAK